MSYRKHVFQRTVSINLNGVHLLQIKHYLLRPAFWECPGVSLLCRTPGSGSPLDHPK